MTNQSSVLPSRDQLSTNQKSAMIDAIGTNPFLSSSVTANTSQKYFNSFIIKNISVCIWYNLMTMMVIFDPTQGCYSVTAFLLNPFTLNIPTTDSLTRRVKTSKVLPVLYSKFSIDITKKHPKKGHNCKVVLLQRNFANVRVWLCTK